LISPLGGQERKLRSVGFFNRYFNSLSWSSDGRYLAYPDAKDPNSRSKLAVLDTQKMQDIYPPLPDCMDTKTFGFARQGHKLGVACKSSRGTAEIYSIPEIGGTPRHIARLSGFTTGLTWTANGQELIVSLVLGQKPLWRVNESTGKLQPLLLGAEAVNLVALHGDRLAFDNRTLTGNIWELDLDSPNPHARQLIASTRLQGDPRFSPDGKHLVFGSSRSGFSEIWMCNSDGSDAVQLTDFRGPLTGSPDWAPDGRTIVFDSRAEWHANLYLMDIDERVPRLLHTDVTENSVPGWSRDGKSIYFRSEGGGKTGIFKVGREGGSAVLVASGDGYYPVESDDGRRLFYHLHDNQARQVVLETGEDEDVPGMPESGLVSWAPAQEGIYSLELTPQGLVMNLHDPITGKSRRLANLSADTHPAAEDRLSVSPGGHRLLFSQIEQESSDIMMVENFH
jgi:Tol biopolymer transport system component